MSVMKEGQLRGHSIWRERGREGGWEGGKLLKLLYPGKIGSTNLETWTRMTLSFDM